MLTDKEKLEEELRFLKESFEIGVITEQEYEQGQRRIEKKMQNLDTSNESSVDENDISVKEIKHDEVEIKPSVESAEETKKETEEIKVEIEETADKIVEKSKKEEKDTSEEMPPIEVEKEEKEEIKADKEDDSQAAVVVDIPEKKEEEPEASSISTEEKEKEEDINGISNEYKKEESEDEEGLGLGWIAVIAIVLLIGAFGFWFFSMASTPENNQNSNQETELEQPAFTAACNSDSDCTDQGKRGTCQNPGLENAECVYKEDIEVPVQLITTECSTCDTKRVEAVLRQFFPNVKVQKIELDTPQGKELVDEFSLKSVPAYIFDPVIVDAEQYENFQSSFEEVKGSYVLKNTVANANYFIEREEKPKTVELFIKPGATVSQQAQKNTEEFIVAFGENVEFIERTDRDPLAEELGINTFPAFLINNKVKFGGVQPADTIKEHYCNLNFVTECNEELSKNLV